MSKVLLTGGTGYIGQYMANLLMTKGYEVVITSRSHDKTVMGYENRTMELLNISTIKGICRQIDIVIHMANLDEILVKSQPQEAFLANSYATRELYLDAVDHGVKHFIYLSTFHVYGASEGEIDEETTVNPQSDYALSHFFAEEYLRQLSRNTHHCKVSVVRLTNGIGLPLKGVKKWYLVINDFCRTAYYKKQIILKSNGLPIRDFVAIRDIIEAIFILIRKSNQQNEYFSIYNISSQCTYSIRQIAYLVKETCYEKYHMDVTLQLPNVTKEQIQSVKPLKISSEKIRTLGWSPRFTVKEVIEEILNGLEAQKDAQDQVG